MIKEPYIEPLRAIIGSRVLSNMKDVCSLIG
jgi:hypothetical protein